MTDLYGGQHKALVTWLTGSWWRDGPAVAAIQGFPGLGKTAIAERVIADVTKILSRITAVHVDCPESTSTLVDDLVLSLAEEFDAKGDGDVVADLERGLDAEAVFRRILNEPRLIILDEAQRLMGETNGTPKNKQLNRILEILSRSAGSPGRILLLSSREFGGARWEEHANTVKLNPLNTRDAREFLNAVLVRDERTGAVPADRVDDVVSWLGGNARAINLLVSALRRDTIDYLIGLVPEAWEARDREVAPRLLREFETKVLTRAIEQLDEKTELLLRRLAVFRKPVPKAALEAIATTDIDMEVCRDELLVRYILEFRTGLYHVHPIVRDTLLHRFSSAQKISAHLVAGNYFSKAFNAKQMVGRAQVLGTRFIEARYHFTLAEAENEMRQIAERFEYHLRAQFNFVTPIPFDSQERDERIALLSALLKSRGPHGLEYHLARCLLARGRADDDRLALPHLRRSTGPQTPASAWVLRIQVEAALFGSKEAVKVAREGIKTVPATQNLFSLYQAAGAILARDGKSEEAVTLLREGIKTPNIGSLSSLYQAAGAILAGDAKSEEAVTLLREGIKTVPATQNLFSLYQAAGAILARDGKSEEAVTLLREGIKTPNIGSLSSLYQAAGTILAGDGKSEEAVTLLREGIKTVPATKNLFSLYQAAGEILARDGKSEEAVTLLREGIKTVPAAQNLFSLYQAAGTILARDGKSEEAVTLLREGHVRIGDRYSGYKLVESAILICSDYGCLDHVRSFDMGIPQARLFDVMVHISKGEFSEAASSAYLGVRDFPRYVALRMQGAFAALAAGDTDWAREFFANYVSAENSVEGTSRAWLLALVELESRNYQLARKYLDAFAGRAHADTEISIDTLLNYWKASCRELYSELAYIFPRIPPIISGSGDHLVRSYLVTGCLDPQKPSNTDVSTSHVEARKDQKAKFPTVCVLSVATEWSSGRGGLSSFNRQLCIALARAGAKVASIVLEATDEEIESAAQDGVTLIVANRGIGLSDEQRLVIKPTSLKEFSPKLVIGHGRITGSAAAELHATHYPNAKRVHFVHMAPDEIEPYKLGVLEQSSIRAQHRTELEIKLCRSASNVVAVGPRLHGRFTTYLAGYKDAPKPLRFDPGFDVKTAEPRIPPEGDPWIILLLGRAEDVPLKGLDTAASAVAKAARDRTEGLPRLELVIRGAQPAEMDQLSANLKGRIGRDRLSIVVRSFTVSDEMLQADLRSASLVLMPSRAEGFGLVGVEAIIAGTPLLVSAESGLGQLLREELAVEQASRSVVEMIGDDQQLHDRWASAISRMLADRKASFERASEVRDAMAKKRTWLNEVDQLLSKLTA